MTRLEMKCFEKLDLYKNRTRNPMDWFKRDKWYTVLLIILLIRDFPFWVLAYLLSIILYIPHEIYEKLDRWV